MYSNIGSGENEAGETKNAKEDSKGGEGSAAEIYKAAKRDGRSNNGKYNETAMSSTGIIADKETIC